MIQDNPPSNPPLPTSGVIYRSFADLIQNNIEGRDFAISYRHTDSDIAIIAPHGGNIEPGTTEIADALAGTEYNYYEFRGIKESGNRILHITSSCFDEPVALRTVRRSKVALTIHGLRSQESLVLIGGRNSAFKCSIQKALAAADFQATLSDIPHLRGHNPNNICNLCRSGEGVQLEISRGLRETLFKNLDRPGGRATTALFDVFITVLRNTIRSFR